MVTTVHTPVMQLRLAGDSTEIDLDALQGLWSAEQYLRLTAQNNRLIEFTDGVIVASSVLTAIGTAARRHSSILSAAGAASPRQVPGAGSAAVAGPDRSAQTGRFLAGADLVVEIVSPDNPERDTQVKRVDYAEAGIPEYWVVDPITESITVLRLAGVQYGEHGIFRRGDRATSALLPEAAIPVDAVLDAE